MRTLSRLATIILVLGGLLLAGGQAAKAGANVPPTNVVAVSNAPRVVTVYWTHSGDGVYEFDV